MSVFQNIAAIQARMKQIQSKFGNNSYNFTPASSGACNNQSNFVQASLGNTGINNLNNSKGITFEQLLSSKLGGNDLVKPTLAEERTPETKPEETIKKPKAKPLIKNTQKTNATSPQTPFDNIINEASKKYGVNETFIKAIIQQESNFNPKATSWVGAMGLMQLMPGTARSLGVKNAYNPKENVMGGVKYIKQQLDRFGGDKRKALAAYNAGPGAVMKYGGIPPYRETQNYVKRIMTNYKKMGGK